MEIREFMSTKIEFVDSEASVYDAVEKMVDRRIRSLVVRFPGKDKDNGVLTTRDVVFKVLAKGANPKQIRVAEIASRPMVCVAQDVVAHEAAKLMERHNVARVFVCSGEKIIGHASLLDVMTAELIIMARGDHVS